MILVDTSVWINHLREGNKQLSEHLVQGDVACHPLIIGELACGHLQRRKEILALLHALPTVERVTDDEILFFIEKHRLFGRGLGLVDMHLLASCSITPAALWTLDGKLQKAAKAIGNRIRRMVNEHICSYGVIKHWVWISELRANQRQLAPNRAQFSRARC